MVPQSARPVIFSPHLDDAVFGVWHILDGQDEVEIYTVFAGVPQPGFVTPLDRSHGAVDSAAWMRRRRAEDRNALNLAHRRPAHLDLLDAQYMLYQDPHIREVMERWTGSFVEAARHHVDMSARVAEVTRAVAPMLTQGPIVYAPVGIGGHPDHRTIGEFAVGLALTGCQVRLWADHPYFVRHGLPSWLGGEPNPVADALVADSLATVVGQRLTLTRDIVTLDAESLRRKLAATRRYLTEYDAIQADFGPAMDPAYLQYEVVWTASASRP